MRWHDSRTTGRFLSVVAHCLLAGSLVFGADSSGKGSSAGFLAGKDAMRSFLRQHDLIYERAPMDWYNGLPLANGNLGVMIWGDGAPLTLTLDSYELWDLRGKKPDPATYNYATMKKLLAAGDATKVEKTFGNNFDKELYFGGVTQTRLTPGRIDVELDGKTVGYQSRLDLFRARAEGTITLDRGSVAYASLVDAVRGVILMDVQTRGGAAIKRINVRASKYAFPNLGYPKPVEGRTGDVSWRRQPQTGGKEYAVAWRIVESPRKDRNTLYCTIVIGDQTNPAVQKAVTRVNEAVTLGLARLTQEHEAWWADYWKRSFLTISDPLIENLYYAEMYKLACLSRLGSSFVGGDGLWLPDDAPPGWSGQYCYDMNAQMSGWCTFPSNHLEQAMPMAESLWRWLPANRQMCRDYYGCEGAMITSGVDFDGREVPGWYCANLWPGCGPWACHTLWSIFQYSQDKDFLRNRAYPMMKAYMGQYLGILERGTDGKWHIPWSPSPEWQDNQAAAWGMDDSGNLALVRFLAKAVLEAEAILGIQSPETSRYRDILANIAPFPQQSSGVGGMGLLLMKNKPLSASHRTHHHVLAIHPLDEITIEGSDADRNLIRQSLDNIVYHGMGAWCGYSISWMSAISARVGQPGRAYQMLKLYADIATVENSFHINGDPRRKGFMHTGAIIVTPEGGLAAAAALLEMLVQSWHGVIRVFPAMPEWWPEASFERLRAEGAFLVSARRRGALTVWVRIESEAGMPCRIRNPFAGPVRLKDEHTGDETQLTGTLLEFPSKKQHAYVLTPWDSADRGEPIEFHRDPQHTNWYGLKKTARF